MFEKIPHGDFQLCFACVSVAGEDFFCFPDRDFKNRYPGFCSGKEYNPCNFSKSNSLFGIFMQGEHIFHDNKVRLLGFNQ